MSNPLYTRYSLDPTGINPDNLVEGEPHTLSNRRYRFCVPKHGPFYVESIRVYDGVTLLPLTNNQYSIPTISQEATLRFGKEIADSIVIEDENVASNIIVTYQSLGGSFQNNIENVISIFEAFLNDNRTIDWVTGVYGKPNEYPPGPHPHHLADIFGFETMTFVLEQIRQAILLGNTPAYQMIFDAFKNYTATIQDVNEGNINDKFVTLEVLQHAARYYNFNSYKLTPMIAIVNDGQSFVFTVEATRPEEIVDTIYWKIEHETTSPLDFIINSGSMTMFKGIGTFTLQTADTEAEEDRDFRIVFYRGGVDNKVELFRSFKLTVKKNSGLAKTIIWASANCCINSPTLARTPLTISVNRGIWNARQS